MKHFNKTKIFILTLLLTCLSIPQFSFAQTNIETTQYSVLYEIHDTEGNLISSGTLPTTEKVISSRESHPSATIANGQTITLKNRATNGPYIVRSNKTINLNFALNKTATMQILFWDNYHANTLKPIWKGLTGGLSTSRTVTQESHVQIEITNHSSNPVTMLWANVTF